MPDPVLLIDQGNTRLKWVMARANEIQPGTAGRGTMEAFTAAFTGNREQRPGRVLFSSVAGAEAAQQVVDFSRDCWGLEARRLVSRSEQGGVRNAYGEPQALGVDRWLAIVGAVVRHGAPVVIWDLGTATTLDAVDNTGSHLGGLILPGPATMLESLRRDTKLPVPDHSGTAAPKPGKNTEDAILNGLIAAQVGALNLFMKNVAGELGAEAKLVVTGGAADALLPSLDFPCTHDPWLVFRGMLIP